MAKTVILNWVDPVTRVNGDALAAAEIAFVNIAVSSDAGASFSDVGTVAAGVQSFAHVGVPDGSYVYRVTVADTQVPSKSSPPVDVAVDVVTVVVLEAPSSVTGLAASVI